MRNVKEKIVEVDNIPIKNLRSSKKQKQKQVEKQFTDWESIFATLVTDEGLLQRLYKCLIQPHVKR